MFHHPYMAAKIAEERRQDLIAQAQAHHRVRIARDGRPAADPTQSRISRAASVIKAVATRSVRARRPLPHEA